MNHGRVRNQTIWVLDRTELDQAQAIQDAVRHAVVARQQLLRIRWRLWGALPLGLLTAQVVRERWAIRAREEP